MDIWTQNARIVPVVSMALHDVDYRPEIVAPLHQETIGALFCRSAHMLANVDPVVGRSHQLVGRVWDRGVRPSIHSVNRNTIAQGWLVANQFRERANTVVA